MLSATCSQPTVATSTSSVTLSPAFGTGSSLMSTVCVSPAAIESIDPLASIPLSPVTVTSMLLSSASPWFWTETSMVSSPSTAVNVPPLVRAVPEGSRRELPSTRPRPWTEAVVLAGGVAGGATGRDAAEGVGGDRRIEVVRIVRQELAVGDAAVDDDVLIDEHLFDLVLRPGVEDVAGREDLHLRVDRVARLLRLLAAGAQVLELGGDPLERVVAQFEGEDDLLLGAFDVARCVEALGAVEQALRGALVALDLGVEADVTAGIGCAALEALEEVVAELLGLGGDRAEIADVVLVAAVLAGVEAAAEGDHDQDQEDDRAEQEARLADPRLLPVGRRTDVMTAARGHGAAAAPDRLSRFPSRGVVGCVVVVEKVHSFRAFRRSQYDPCPGRDGCEVGKCAPTWYQTPTSAGGRPAAAKASPWSKASKYWADSRSARRSAGAVTAPSIAPGTRSSVAGSRSSRSRGRPPNA